MTESQARTTAADVSDGDEEKSGKRRTSYGLLPPSYGDEEKSGKCRSSFGWLPPSLSEMRVVLLGNSWSQRSSVGNLLLREPVFNTEDEADRCLRVRGQIKEKEVVLINTPDLLLQNISDDKLTEHVELCVRLSAPGPHVFLLVLQPEDFTVLQRWRICRVLELFSDQSFDHSMVLVSTPRDKSSADYRNDPSLQEMIRKCRDRCFWMEKRKRRNVLKQLQNIFEENKRQCVSCDQLKTATVAFTRGHRDMARNRAPPPPASRAKPDERKPTTGHVQDEACSSEMRAESNLSRELLRILLVGNTGCGKSSTANTILGRKHFVSRDDQKSETSVCQIGTADVDGRLVVVVDSPGLFNSSLSSDDIQRELLKCISFLSPGPHAILLVRPIGRFTEEEEKAVKLIKKTFGDNPEDYIMVLFTRGDDLSVEGCHDFVKDLIRGSGDRYHVFNNKDVTNRTQVKELLDKIDNMVRKNGGGCYTIGTRTEKDVKKMKEEMEEMKKEFERKHEEEMKGMKEKIEALEMQAEKAKREEEREKNKKQQQSYDEMIKEMLNLRQQMEDVKNQKRDNDQGKSCGVM